MNADTKDSRLPLSLSIYLDLMRFGAAAAVFIAHAWHILYPTIHLQWPAHESVVVFFVLSGLVIAHATNRVNLTLTEYAIHRAARIWSVAIPALILSVIVSIYVGGAGLGNVAPAVNSGLNGVWMTFTSLFPIGQLWFLAVDPPLNAPFWSLNFEVWYYALFGAWMFLRGHQRTIAVTLVAMTIGPKILLLLPVWLFGVGIYWYRPKLNKWVAVMLLFITTALALEFIRFNLSTVIHDHMMTHWPHLIESLGGADRFVGDWLFMLIIGANFAAIASLGQLAAPLLRCAKPIRAAAGCTFSAYLYHMPLLTLFVIGFHLHGWMAMVAVALAIIPLAQISEKQLTKTRRLVRWVSKLFHKSTLVEKLT